MGHAVEALHYDQALRDYFTSLLAAHGGDRMRIWSIGGVHREFLGPPAT